MVFANSDKTTYSENIVYLQPDGKSYLLHRTMRTDWPRYDFHVDKQQPLDDFYFISPNEFEWDDASSETTNILKFNSGDYVVIYPGQFSTEVTVNDTGIHRFNSWDGVKRSDGLFGIWNTPNDFKSFIYVWVVPENIEILSYKSNREGEWVKRHNAITFFATDTNNLTFEITYRQRDRDMDGVVDNIDQCPETAAGIKVDATGCEVDTDKDGVIDSKDQCPNSLVGAKVDTVGCELDSDKDGVADSKDQCPNTSVGAKVNAAGCEL
ncbi:MAG: thrombospondin type 3 repeat-containing protein, partial [Gammaproteobacteria bacterium]|nr:thrombospondin type 3 repeat-containing protein [Gammaproteobacteria bacterium]